MSETIPARYHVTSWLGQRLYSVSFVIFFIFVINLMQSIYNYIPDTDNISSLHNVAGPGVA